MLVFIWQIISGTQELRREPEDLCMCIVCGGSGCLLTGGVSVQANEVPSALHSSAADWKWS